MKIDGWPDKDPYPYRDADGRVFRPAKEPVDSDFVKMHKQWVEDDDDKEYEYYLKLAWTKINEMAAEIQAEKDHVKWLRNVGGKELNFALGVDIMCRGLAKDKSESEAK